MSVRAWRGRRRLSQLDLALNAGTTQRHISFIESGRSTPGRGMVIRIAEALELPLRERNALLLAAGYAPAYRETPLDAPKLGAVSGALKRILAGHEPYPAVIVDHHGELLLSNGSFRALTQTVQPRLLRPPVNLPRLLLDPDGMAPRIINFDVWAWHIIDAVRREAARVPDERNEALAAELEQLVPPRPRAVTQDYLGLAVPLRLRSARGELELLTTLSHFGTTVDVTLANLRLEAFLPGDETTARILIELGRTPVS